MRKISLLKTSLFAFTIGLFMASCSSDNTDVIQTDPDVIQTDPDPIPSAFIDLTLAENEITGNFMAVVEGEAGGVVNGRVRFTSDSNMRRLYVTRTLPGGQPEPFNFVLDDQTLRQLTKPDGSIDLDGDEQDQFDFSFPLDVPASATDGAIVYNFWATSGRGDFRDPSRRLRVGVGTIQVMVGTGISSQNLLVQDNIVLEAPLQDASSETFVSFFELDRVFRINEGAEFSTFWDFGYFFGNTMNASLASTNNYPNDVFNLLEQANMNNEDNEDDDIDVVQEDLNNVYFVLNNSIVFDSITTLSELNAIINTSFSVSTESRERVTDLSEGDVIEFLDGMGRRGLIRIDSISSGFNGSITLSIIAQPSQPIMDGSNF